MVDGEGVLPCMIMLFHHICDDIVGFWGTCSVFHSRTWLPATLEAPDSVIKMHGWGQREERPRKYKKKVFLWKGAGSSK